MDDTIFIPHKDALLALDLVSASLQNSLDVGITLSNTPDYLRLKNIFTFNNISGPFANLCLNASLQEGMRKMFQNQPIHVRNMSSKTNDDSILIHNN